MNVNDRIWTQWKVGEDIKDLLDASPRVIIAEDREELFDKAVGGRDVFDVEYQLGDGNVVKEAVVARCKNGLAINYYEKEMRRRDPECLLIGDEKKTDKTRFKERYGEDFSNLRRQTFQWLQSRTLLVAGIHIGGPGTGLTGLIIAPENTGFFVGGICDLQGMIPLSQVEEFAPDTVIYLAPVFRHTYFKGEQVVVHRRQENRHEIFSYNLYPGPSAKKGVYGVLLQKGEEEDWLTLHASTVQAVTPYENVTTFLHEGASGGGKSEMLEYPHREENGELLLGTNVVSGKSFMVNINQFCELHPVTDDMAHVDAQKSRETGKLVVSDAENAWFLRVNHLTRYGTDPHLENICIHPKKPLLFLNINAAPNSTALLWEHIEDAPGTPCPNPRVILPREDAPLSVSAPAEIDFRSFGIRAPLCHKENISYGIIGLCHILPPALAWLWRLVSPRGHGNPSILEEAIMSSEGVGSYWPFATGRFITHANLLLQQIVDTPETRYLLFPNQSVGAWRVGFMPQWICREYFARRGTAKFKKAQLKEARCALLGYTPARFVVEGIQIPDYFFQVENQHEVDYGAYDEGARMLHRFFANQLEKYRIPELDPVGRKIIDCFLRNGTVEEYEEIIPMRL
ncbi:MAG: DUF4914 family protein [Candidatus Omnitrophica bacterium]|nr:DUF4914 family protein [Candidatus Omnitrophota bacterium]